MEQFQKKSIKDSVLVLASIVGNVQRLIGMKVVETDEPIRRAMCESIGEEWMDE